MVVQVGVAYSMRPEDDYFRVKPPVWDKLHNWVDDAWLVQEESDDLVHVLVEFSPPVFRCRAFH